MHSILCKIARTRGKAEPLHISESAESVALDPVYRVVRQHQQLQVGRAREGVSLHLPDLVVAEVYRGDVLQARERELRHRRQGGLLDGELFEPGQAPEGERLDNGYVIPVEGQLPQVSEAGERVALDDGEVVAGERQVFHGGRQQFLRDLPKSPRIAQHLQQGKVRRLSQRRTNIANCEKGIIY